MNHVLVIINSYEALYLNDDDDLARLTFAQVSRKLAGIDLVRKVLDQQERFLQEVQRHKHEAIEEEREKVIVGMDLDGELAVLLVTDNSNHDHKEQS
ncbi:MAG: hypothetical protein ACKV2O_15455 [Acidimicrobiales bacterium]